MTTRLLISVRDAAEARLAFAARADIIDAKAPEDGALGAVAPETLTGIVAAVGGRAAVSATIGDGPFAPAELAARVSRTAEAGVDFVKVGLFPGQAPGHLAALAPSTRLIAVVFAEDAPQPTLAHELADTGVAGILIDTRDKASGGLTAKLAHLAIARFVAAVRGRGLLAGLAGSLAIRDIAAMRAHNPDVMGFRGAACYAGRRGGALDPVRLAAIADAMRAAATSDAA